MGSLVREIEPYGTIVGVYGRFDAVADIVRGDVADRADRDGDRAGVRVAVGKGVSIDDPDQASVGGADHEIRVAILLEERRDELDALANVAAEQDAGTRFKALRRRTFVSPRRRLKASFGERRIPDADAAPALIGRIVILLRPCRRRRWRGSRTPAARCP